MHILHKSEAQISLKLYLGLYTFFLYFISNAFGYKKHDGRRPLNTYNYRQKLIDLG